MSHGGGAPVLSTRTLIALLSSYLFFCTCLDQAGARSGLDLARGFLRFLRVGHASDQTAARFGSGSRPLVFFR